MKEKDVEIKQDNVFIYPKLDYAIEDMQERNKIVHHIIDTIPKEKLTSYYLQKLTKYLVITPQNKKERHILTKNRLTGTVNKRQLSFEGLVAKLQNGEDGIYNFITGGDKNIYLVPKIKITQKDIETVPGLRELTEEIQRLQMQQKKATGKKKYLLTKQLIQARKQRYTLRSAYKPVIFASKIVRNTNRIDFSQNITIDKNGEPISDGLISFFNPQHVSHLLCHYSNMKQDAWGNFQNDLFYLMEDFDNLVDKALKQNYPVFYSIVIYKIDGLTNKQILEKIKQEHDAVYSIQYLSKLWRKKIPEIIAETAKKDWLIWHYTFEEKGQWKRCSKCHEIKLAHPYFFTKNRTSKDGWYSLCKDCRNKKKGQNQIKRIKKF